MASISSTNGSSSLGNTALRGFGGMASGIDRDSIIEKMTLGTTTKINNQKNKITQLQWKQEAYRSISDKIIGWSDTYASYASSSNLKDPSVFAKNQITVHGKDSSKGLISANGSSSLIDSLSILAVNSLASAAVRQSQKQIAQGGLQLDMGNLSQTTYTPKLAGGAKLVFESTIEDSQGKRASVEFALKDKYTVGTGDDAKEISINYAPQTAEEYKALETALNAQLQESEVKLGEGNLLKDAIEFKYEEGPDGPMIKILSKTGNSDYQLKSNYASQAFGYGSEAVKLSDLNSKTPTAFSKSGISSKTTLDAIRAGGKLTFNYNGTSKSMELITADEAKAIKEMTIGDLKDLLANAGSFDKNSKLSDLQNALNKRADEIKDILGKPEQLKNSIKGIETAQADITKKIDELTEKLGNASGTDADNLQAEIDQYNAEMDRLNTQKSDLQTQLTEANDALAGGNKEALEAELASIEEDLVKVSEQQFSKIKDGLQSRLDKAFGKDAVKVGVKDGKLNFNTDDSSGSSATISITSNNTSLLKTLGIDYGASNKINLNGKLTQDALGLGSDLSSYTVGDSKNLDLVINGVEIKGLTTSSTINDIISKINSTKEAGVKATYVDATGQFMLVASETGKGREITLGGKDGKDDTNSLAWKLFGGEEAKGAHSADGENAKIVVSYGNGVNVELERSSNTFNLEGLNVTVSGKFGEKDVDGKWKTSEAVTFSAKADVDGALEKVKKFIEDYNALVTEIDSQIKTRPDSNYGPLTDEQKAEMDETSIENWENKAKQGMLYGDAAMRDLSMDVQSVFTKMMNNGASYEAMKEIGITYSEDWGDGGTLVFDEAKFKEAMENDPDKVANIFTGGGDVKKGLISTIEETFTPYATRYANKNGNGGKGSYGRLIEIAGSEKKPTTIMDNEIYRQLKEMQETIDKLQDQLKVEQDRYISQFTTMESLLNQMNTQSSYLSQLTA